MAQSLFEQGRRDFAEGEYDSACQKLAESRKLDNAPGTLLNLALCHEMQGKVASAWAEYNEVLALATKAGDDERAQVATERVQRLAPRLSYLVIDVPQDCRVPELAVSLDGVVLGPSAWGTPLPVDPGSHLLSATAKDHLPWSVRVAVAADAERQTVTVPPMRVKTQVVLQQVPSSSDLGPQPLRTIALGALGVAAASLVAGSYFGLRARSSWQERNRLCEGGTCDARAVEAWHDAKRFAAFADGAFALGLVTAGAGFYFLLVRSSDARAPQQVGLQHIGLQADRIGVGLSLGGTL